MRGPLNGHDSYIDRDSLPAWETPREDITQPRECCDRVVEVTDRYAVVERAPGFRVALPISEMSRRLYFRVDEMPEWGVSVAYVIAPDGQQPKYRAVEEG